MSSSYASTPANAAFTALRCDGPSADVLHRVDAPHAGTPLQATTEQRTADIPNSPTEPRDTFDFDPAKVRVAHTEDLIGFLQQWSEELDDRAARLNADMATHERRERAFRLWMQNRRLELETQIAEYQQAQQRAELIARRLAIGG